MHGYLLGTAATDALVPKHQAISNYSADKVLTARDQFHSKICHLLWLTFENNIIFWKKMTHMFEGLYQHQKPKSMGSLNTFSLKF